MGAKREILTQRRQKDLATEKKEDC